MTREQALDQARAAAGRAVTLAEHAESAAHSNSDHTHSRAANLAAAGALWADVARSYVAIADATPEPSTEQQEA